MFNLGLFLIYCLHFALLAGGFVWLCRRLQLPKQDVPFVVYLGVWITLVLTGHAASLLKSLNDLSVYQNASFGVMAVLLLVAYGLGRDIRPPLLANAPQLDFEPIRHERTRKFLWIFLLVTLGYVAIISVLIGNLVYPDNADSMIYRLPRAFWYVSNGSFLHPFTAEDQRITWYPLNGAALYVPIVLYQLPGVFFSHPSLITWAIIILATYRFARELGAERLLALSTCWLVAMTPSILAQANSTNDEILAAGALLTGALMLWRWLRTGRVLYLVLALTAVGLSAGTKLHIVMMLPSIGAIVALAVWAAIKRPALLPLWWQAAGWRATLAGLTGMALMFVPFLIFNYYSTGRFYYTSEFVGEVFNLTGNIRTIVQNFIIYISQLVIAPIADLNFWPVANDRQNFNTTLNEIFNPLIMPLMSSDPSHYHYNYRFSGVTILTSVRFVEFSLWSGFVWALWPLTALLAWRQKNFIMRGVFTLVALIPLIWFVTWCLTVLYMEGAATYLAFYLICAAPATIFAFMRIRSLWRNELRWALIGFVGLTSLIICTNMFMFSGFRSIPDLFYAKKLPFDWNLAQQSIIEEIRRAERIRVVFTHEKMPYFAYMHWNPGAKYLSPYPLPSLPERPQEILQLYPASSIHQYGFMPIKIPGKRTTGMTYLGVNRAIGREVVFATGNDVHLRHPTESDYIVPQLLYRPNEEGYEIFTRSEFAGLNAADRLEWKFVLTRNNKVLFMRDWDMATAFKFNGEQNFSDFDNKLTISVRDADTKRELATVTYPALVPGSWLPDIGEYE
jgi:hypothetical protein